jgi:phage I-like protein
MPGIKASAALAAVQALNAEGGAPEFIMLLPPGRVVQTVDGRGPYHVVDAAQLATDSLQAAGGMLPIDENHSTDLAAPKGEPSPARGWIVGLEARATGLFGKVEWTESGKQLLADRAYRGISPVIMHAKDGRVLSIPRASLTNTPNLRGMAALHAEENQMEELLSKLRSLLGLDADSDTDKIYQAVSAVVSAATAEKAKAGAALQTALAPIAQAAGLNDNADQAAIVAAVTTLAAGDAKDVAALQAEIVDLGKQLATIQKNSAQDKATAFVDGAIKAGRVGVKPLRDRYLAMHAADPANTEALINAMPMVGPSGAQITPPAKDKDGKLALNAEQLQAATVLGVKPEDYAKTLQAEDAAA